jgi:IclR family transcriptional regulator, positive regulator for flagellar biogenesis
MPRSAAPTPVKRDGAAGGTQTLGRGLDVLRAFRCEPRPLGNRTIAERTGLPKSTVSRITSTLVSLGYLTRLPPVGHYQLGTRVLNIGNAYLESSEVRREAKPLMEQFAARHGVSSGLAVGDGLEMMYIAWCRSPKTLTLRLSEGSRLPIARTAIGKAYLWALPPAERRELMTRIRQSAGARARIVMDRINSAFEDLDRFGYCISLAEYQKNTFGVGVPMVLDEGQTIVVMSAGAAQLDVTETVLRRSVAPDLVHTAALLRAAVADARDIST